MSVHPGSLLFDVWAALFATGLVAFVGADLREWKRNAPLRQQARTRPITFRTDLSWVSFPDPPPWWRGERRIGRGGGQLMIRGDWVRVGRALGVECRYFRAPETTIELGLLPLRIFGIGRSHDWIVVRSRQDGQVLVSVTKKYFFDDVWNALVAAGAVPTTGGPAPRNAWRETRT